MKLSPGSLSPGSSKYTMGSFSPVGLHVLVVDDDPLCLMVLDRMLKQCNYNVTTCCRVNLALQLLRENKDDYDLVMSDVYMPDEDGFKLLEVIGLELDLPVIMMSANAETSVVMQGITHGACDYLIKPIRMEELRNIWQHVIRRKGKEVQRGNMQGELDETARGSESQDQISKKRKELLEMEDCSSMDGLNSLKKARVNWSIQLHRQFVDAVNQLGVDKAVPKRILDIMNVQGLTRENVASHLQKYRLYLKRLSGVVPEPCPIASFQASGDGRTGGAMMVQPAGKAPTPNLGVKGRNLGAGIGCGPAKDKKIDVSTMESLAKYKLHQQQHAANRAQVLGGLGLSDTRSLADVPTGGLQRMSSLDLSFFLQAQCLDSLPTHSVDAVDDLAACNFRTVKLEDDMAMASGVSVSGVNNKRTYPSRQGAARHGHVGQWNMGSHDANDQEKHKRGGSASELNMQADTGFCELGSYDKVMDSMAGYKEGGGIIVGFNNDRGSRGVGCNKAFRGSKEISSSGGGYNAAMISAKMGLHDAIGGAKQQHYLEPITEEQRGGGVYGTSGVMAYTPSLADIADDEVSSTNVEFSTVSSVTEISGDAFSESSFSALVQLDGILSPPPAPSTGHPMHNIELDISDYLQL
eukprot:c33250_g1_i1 orf=158-2065(+)